MLTEIIKRGPKIELAEFLKTFDGPVYIGREELFLAMNNLRATNKPCVVVFEKEGWWTVLKNGRDFMNCLKLIQER